MAGRRRFTAQPKGAGLGTVNDIRRPKVACVPRSAIPTAGRFCAGRVPVDQQAEEAAYLFIQWLNSE